MKSRELTEQSSQWTEKLNELQQTAVQLDGELTVALSKNLALQNTIDLLRGSDAIELERDMAADIEALRQESRDREEQLKTQLGEAMARLNKEKHSRANDMVLTSFLTD